MNHSLLRRFLPNCSRALASMLLAATATALTGCASLPPLGERPVTTAIDPATKTALSKIAIDSSPGDDLTGFRLMPVGSFALDTRVQLAQRAEKTLDVQYYLMADDRTGRYLMRALRDAALRGVRVRILLDDLYTGGEDDLLLGLAATPNIEIRLFNPFPGGRGGFLSRFAASPQDIGRLNHRMHNKLFIADNAMAVAGGRNIADEYFQRSTSENFVDLDLFVCGAVVPQLSDIFDEYWNSNFVYPLKAIAHSSQSHNQLVQSFKTSMNPENAPIPEALPPNDVLGYGPLSDDLERGRLGLIWGIAFAYADVPAKIISKDDKDNDTVQYNLIELMSDAKSEVLISSPYMIPGKAGMAMMEGDRKRGVRVRVMTNSLASTDEPVVHIGYSHYRRAMIKAGVEVFELSPGRIKKATRLGVFGTSIGRLHAKIAVIDKQTVFIGSMNFDPRSANENTELAIISENGQLAREVSRLLDITQLQSCYRVLLDKEGNLEWVSPVESDMLIEHDEPDTGWWLRFQQHLLSPLAPEELL